MSLLDLGSDIPVTTGNQQLPQQHKQQQPMNFDLLGTSQGSSQQQPQTQGQQMNFDPFSASESSTPVQQAQQLSLDDAFGTPQPPSQQNAAAPASQQQLSGLDALLTGTPPQPTNQQPVQPHELNFDAFEDPKAPTHQQQQEMAGTAQPSLQNTTQQNTAVNSAATMNGNAAGATAVETQSNDAPTPASQPVSTAAAGTEKPQTSALDNKAKLKEIEELFGGRWRLVRSDPFAEYLKAAGVGLMTRNRAASGTPDLQISVLDEHIYMNTSSVLHSQINKFRLDEVVENVVHKINQSVFCSYQDKKIELQMTPSDVAFSKTQGVEYSFNDKGELMVIYASGSAVCRRFFAKVIYVAR